MTTAFNTINVKYVISKSDSKVYSVDTVHMEKSNGGGTSFINNPTVVNQTPTTDGLITFNTVNLWQGGNSIKMYLSDSADLDSVPVITKLGSTYIRYIGISPTEVEI